jgi:hypothetical protein
MLTPQPPGVLPAGAAGVAKDVAAYDNVVALVEGKGGNGQVFVGSLVRCGDCWRPVDPPQVSGEAGDVGEAVGFFTPRAGGRAQGPAGPQDDERLKPLLAKLRDIEAKMPTAAGTARQDLAVQQAGLLEQVLAAAAATDKGFWARQLAETLAALVQEAALPDGIAKLEKLAEAVADDEALSAFTAFRLAQARYAAGMQQPGADVEKVQAA